MKDDETKLFAFLGIFLTIIGWLIVYMSRKNDKYAMHYAKQGLVLFFGAVIAAIAQVILGWIPVIGRIITGFFWLLIFALWIVGIVYSLSGKEKDVPLVGDIAKNI